MKTSNKLAISKTTVVNFENITLKGAKPLAKNETGSISASLGTWM